MSSWTRLLCRILDSSLWQEPDPTRIVWVTLLAMAHRDGYVWASDIGIASRAREPLDVTMAALKKFQEPDELSTTPDNDGVRIRKVPGGYLLLNYEKIRDEAQKSWRREYLADKQADHRAKKKQEQQQNLRVEFPKGFPKTAEEAKAMAAVVGCPPEFAEITWNMAAGRGGRDWKNVPILRFQNHLASAWGYQRGKTKEGNSPDWKRLQILTEKIAKHPANRESTYHKKDSSEKEKQELVSLKKQEKEIRERMAGQGG